MGARGLWHALKRMVHDITDMDVLCSGVTQGFVF